jgi:hypothetical protein
MKSFRGVLALLLSLFTFFSTCAYSQKGENNQITCFKTQLKNPYSFLGMSGESFELADGTVWKSLSSSYSTVSTSSSSVLVCPELGKMFAYNAAISVERVSKKPW